MPGLPWKNLAQRQQILFEEEVQMRTPITNSESQAYSSCTFNKVQSILVWACVCVCWIQENLTPFAIAQLLVCYWQSIEVIRQRTHNFLHVITHLDTLSSKNRDNKPKAFNIYNLFVLNILMYIRLCD